MRVEPHGVGSVLHVIKRGARGSQIVHDTDDRQHFMRSLFFLNDTYQDPNVTLIISSGIPLVRPEHWPEGEPLVALLAWTLMPNHLHLVLQEVREGGIAKFMQRLGGSMSARHNAKYSEKGSLFQGGYKGRVVEDDADLRWLASYVMVKNVFELYPAGLKAAARDFDKAWEWAKENPYTSLSAYAASTPSPILAKDNVLFSLLGTPSFFKHSAKDMIRAYVSRWEDERLALALEHD